MGNNPIHGGSWFCIRKSYLKRGIFVRKSVYAWENKVFEGHTWNFRSDWSLSCNFNFYRKLSLRKVVFMLVSHLSTRSVLPSTWITNWCFIRSYVFICNMERQVERGKQARYCYDDAELIHLQKTFPTSASYHIQRFKGKDNWTTIYWIVFLCAPIFKSWSFFFPFLNLEAIGFHNY